MEKISELIKGSLHRGNCQTVTATPRPSNGASSMGADQQELLNRLRRELRVQSLDHTFANFKHAPGTDDAFRSFKALAEGLAAPGLLCYGGVGNGKSYLCEALAIELYRRGQFVRVLTMADLMMALKSSMRPEEGEPSLEQILANYYRARRLILDDVGMGGSGSAWEYGKLEEIVVYRYREGLLTVLTTNRDLTELPERVVSRFQDPDFGRAVLNQGKDFRQIKGKVI